jgi:hypothetical protein
LVLLCARRQHNEESIGTHAYVPFADRAGELRQATGKASGLGDNKIVGQPVELAERDFDVLSHSQRSSA